MLRQTYSYVELELSPEAFNEIAVKLRAAGYDHAFQKDGAIDMHGIAVTASGRPGAINPEREYLREK